VLTVPNPAKPELKIEDLWYRFALSFELIKIDRIPSFDIRYSLFYSFFFDLTGRFLAGGWAEP
jgi:hypothetical protein